MITPRQYQLEAIDALFDYWREEPGSPIVELATGCGKSLVMAEIVRKLIEGWPDMRVVIATHVAELIDQNFSELIGIWPQAPAGIFSAGVGRRDYRAQVLFAGIQTVHSKTSLIGHVDVLMVDEAHLIPKSADTMYGRFISALKEINPDLKLVGLTATPFRLDSGRLDEGDDKLFDRIVYTYGVGDGIRDGFLAPLSSKPTETAFDLTGVGRVGGDYNQGKLQAAVDKSDINDKVAGEIVRRGQGRRSWLLFCAGVEHAEHMRDKMRALGITCETVTGETPKEERRRILEDFKAYRIQALTNNSVLTTGFNHKGVDLIAFLRPTLSCGLYVQMSGRGTRPLYAPGADMSTTEGRLAGIAVSSKPNCLVLDFAGLVRRHGPVDMIEPKRPGKGDGEAPVKQCPECDELVHASLRVCTCCGHVFEIDETPKISEKPDVTPILSTEAPDWHPVSSQTFRYHEKVGGTPSVRIEYRVGPRIEKTWSCPQHTGFAKSKSDRWWAQHGGSRPFPSSVDEFLDRAGELAPTEAIKIKFGPGKFNEVVEFRPGPRPEGANDNVKVEPRERSGNLIKLHNGRTIDWDGDDRDIIPF
jgi:DNA repair protein RadD